MSLQDQLRAGRDGQPALPRRHAPRIDLVVAWGILLGPALALAAWGAARQRVGDLEERLVRDAAAIWTVSHARPVHVDEPLPGAVADALAEHLPALDAEARASREDDAGREALRAVVAGEAPLSTLPARHAAALARLAPALDGVLASARAERADFDAARDPFGPTEGAAGFLGLQHAALLAGARVRLAVAAGEPWAGLRDCLDALGLGRDAAIGGGLVGHMVGAAVVTRLAPPCAAALEALPAVRLPDAARRVRAIRDAFPPFSATLREEAVALQLFAGEALPARVRARLPPRARALVATGMRDPSLLQVLLARDAWRSTRRALDRAIAAADLPDAEREAALAEVTAELDGRLNFAPAIALPLEGYLKFARRADDARRRLDGLVAAAAARAFRAERGRWPASLPELDGEARLGAAAEALRLAPARPGEPLLIEIALLTPPQSVELGPGWLTLAVRPPRGGAGGARPARPRAAPPP